jgi:hypothetical protein
MNEIIHILSLVSWAFFGLLALFLILRSLTWKKEFWRGGFSTFVVEYIANATAPRKDRR